MAIKWGRSYLCSFDQRVTHRDFDSVQQVRPEKPWVFISGVGTRPSDPCQAPRLRGPVSLLVTVILITRGRPRPLSPEGQGVLGATDVGALDWVPSHGTGVKSSSLNRTFSKTPEKKMSCGGSMFPWSFPNLAQK